MLIPLELRRHRGFWLERFPFASHHSALGSKPVGTTTDFANRIYEFGLTRLERQQGRITDGAIGAPAVGLIRDGAYGCMVALDPPNILAVPLGQAIARIKTVPLDSDVVQTGRSLGICLGD